MKGILKALVVLILIILTLAIYQNYKDSKSKDAQPQNSQSTPSIPNNTPISAPQAQSTNQLNQNIQPQNPALLNNPNANSKNVQMLTVKDKKQDFVNAANAVQCSIIYYQQSGNSATIRLQSKDRNALGDFLDECIKRGLMRDFVDLKQFKMIRSRNSDIFTTAYKINW
jgi:hypothetical protein